MVTAAQIDRSWYARPGSGPGVWHVVVDGAPACNRHAAIAASSSIPAGSVAGDLRCGRAACRKRWPPLDLGRCTGHCCRELKIPFSPEELRTGHSEEGRELYEAVFLTEILELVRRDKDGERWVYNCTKLTKNGDCGIYHRRPTMCADHPYGRACKFDGCTWGDARNSAVRHPVHLATWQPGADHERDRPRNELLGRTVRDATPDVQTETAAKVT